MITKPELLLPAGTFEKLCYAIAFGADSVYLGLPIFSLRARENDFHLDDLVKSIEYAHNRDKKVYLTANVFARNVKIQSFINHLKKISDLNMDALIMSDPGLISIVRETFPEIPIHLSVQANCMNWQAAKFWQKLGIKRIILSRELRLEEIKEMKQRVPDMEFESFVHGSICIAYSGRCLLSHYMSYRDANQGVCDNSCRYPFHIYTKEKLGEDSFYIEDLRQKESFYKIDEDDNGTFIMNAKDLCLIEYLKELVDAGVTSFKIEGRTKSLYYVSMTARAYRGAVDDVCSELKFNYDWRNELEKIPNRGYDSGFMMNTLSHQSQNYIVSNVRKNNCHFGGVVNKNLSDNIYVSNNTNYSKELLAIDVRHRLCPGMQVDLISPSSTKSFTIHKIFNLKMESLAAVHSGSGLCFLELANCSNVDNCSNIVDCSNVENFSLLRVNVDL